MKNIALVILSIATVVFASLYLRQTGKVIQSQTAMEGLQRTVGELQSTVDDGEKKTAKLKGELEEVRLEATARGREVAQLKAASANPGAAAAAAIASAKPSGAKAANPLSSLAKMFDDPEMKAAIAAQQKAAMGPMIDKTYGKLFADLKLTPEQTASLKEMLLNKQMAGAEMGMSMLSGGGDATKTAELGQKVKAASDAADAEIKAFLGDEKFSQLKTYEKSAADRMAVNGFKDQLGPNAALTGEQEEQLIGMMTKARENFKFTTDFSDKSKMTGDFSTMFTEENVNRYMQELDQLNQNFISHAQNILTPDQLELYQKHLNSQQALQKVGMQMGAKMFAPAKESP